ncbi:putative translation initiation factor, aIF-2BI family [Thermosinus carboxydivorans Nor1]|uniref:Methylthioribose-1-phosphate isomerase n=1 Tax=Thermosinus carboxydivorans Nor1 TaxID=401526 RepID=A1HTS9_9FIRM|nr:S-methyl-5-thioribose-1-phosphate isomerase [Thermosinus carboxydivorans]EAX46563.1 putative translation initiation factor, aIF-2BI family [Thermosinus carboxydivorans Nor1]
MLQSIIWSDGVLQLLNQTLLPAKVEYISCRDWQTVAEAIRRLEVRGAPAIGAAAAFGLVLGARELITDKEKFWTGLTEIAAALRKTRPTAVNLFWAIDRMLLVASRYDQGTDPAIVVAALEDEAKAIAAEDKEVNKKISLYGAQLFTRDEYAVLTHCNAGALATVAFGTALGVIRQAWSEGKIKRVFVDETRPLLQGARLTAWELAQENIPVTLITDNMAGWVMKKGMVQAVLVGADRIARNGDVANKIGTYSVAVLAKEHGIPFFVAAPVSTFDFTIASGADIPIEERSADEVSSFGGIRVAPDGIDIFNPAFDVTPNEYITAIITEYGVLRPPYDQAIADLANSEKIKIRR